MGGAIINAVGQIGRAIGLAIATSIQVTVQDGGADPNETVLTANGWEGNVAFLAGLRSAEWFNCALSLVAFAVAAVSFRSAGKVGGGKK